MFVAVFRCIFWRLVLPLSHLIIHPVQHWSGFLRHFWSCFGLRIFIIVFNNESVRVLCDYNRSLRSYFHQCIRFPLLRRSKSHQHSILSSLMSKRLQQVSPFFDAAQFASSEVFEAHQESFRCIARPNSSSASTLLWLFLHLHLFLFFSTSLQNNL